MKTLMRAAAAAVTLIAASPAAAQELYVGQIITVGFNFCPYGTMEANGQLLSISSNEILFSLLGTDYGGDGITTFALPDLRGRVPMGSGTGPGLPRATLGDRLGNPSITLAPSQNAGPYA